MTPDTLAVLIRHTPMDQAAYALILAALAGKLRDDFSGCATDDAVDSLDLAAEQIGALRQYTGAESRAHLASYFDEQAADAAREGA